ncbi:hypothetical protein C5S32_03000 [ANME-1 cluster archaeon GoMg1]|nr:hypothetical protein [ANME-1 cluster archaeon GoMg1]
MEENVKPRVVIDDRIRHGKPIIKGTRITIDEVLKALDVKELENTVTSWLWKNK